MLASKGFLSPLALSVLRSFSEVECIERVRASGFLTGFALALLFPVLCFAASLETVKVRVVATLQREQPAVAAEFVALYTQYEARVIAFFSLDNHESLAAHIKHMEHELHVLHNVCHDARYQSVRNLLLPYYTAIAELISVLKQHRGLRNTLSLCFKLHKFKSLLPERVRARGDIALFWSMHHRLRCE